MDRNEPAFDALRKIRLHGQAAALLRVSRARHVSANRRDKASLTGDGCGTFPLLVLENRCCAEANHPKKSQCVVGAFGLMRMHWGLSTVLRHEVFRNETILEKMFA